MLTKTRRLIWVLWVTAMAACADLPSEQPQSATSIANSRTDVVERAETPAAQLEADFDPNGLSVAVEQLPTPAAQLEVEFDPDGLRIGPGSRFAVLNDPAVIPGTQASWLTSDELVLGVVVGDEARAYPISQMAYHHIANDQIDGEPYLVTY